MNHSILHNQFYVQYFKKQSLNNFNKIYSLLNKKDYFSQSFWHYHSSRGKEILAYITIIIYKEKTTGNTFIRL